MCEINYGGVKMKVSKEKPEIFPYKDANLNYILEPDDFLKFLEDYSFKEDLDSCLNGIK